ncbi:serine/threonine-protein kinase haspin [Anomaloglossus baeobatrachus]|uniref:serine/threonine-protein kinase haspin n=1 Tax=Anomaloglossus baeobatrachus TaxID=238106 RepID=UPI003F504F76
MQRSTGSDHRESATPRTDMAGRCGGARGGVIRTYARLRPVRRVESQKWFSPVDRKHLFSSSSSHLESSHEASSTDDPDFIPKRKSLLPCIGVNLKPKRRTTRKKRSVQPLAPHLKTSSTRCSVQEKENDDMLHPSSPGILSTPLRKFVTIRRKPPGSVVEMKRLSCKPRRGMRTFLSPGSGPDITADNVRRKKQRMCTDLTNLLNSSSEMLHSPLQKPPLLSSTPSMMLTAVPRKRNAFVRQLALCEPLEDSVVLCGADSDCSCDERPPFSCGGPQDGLSLPQKDAIISYGGRSGTPRTSSEERGKSAMETKLPKSVHQESAEPGSGVKRLMIKTSNDRKSSSVCLLSPIVVSSPRSQSIVFIGEKSARQECFAAFSPSAELFSGDFPVEEETSPTLQVNREKTQQPYCSKNSTACVQGLGSSPPTDHLQVFPPRKSKDFSRKRFQPFVRLNSQTVTEYFRQKGVDCMDTGRERCDLQLHAVTAMSRGPSPRMDRCGLLMQPVVILDSVEVSKYKLKEAASEDFKNLNSLPKVENSVVLAHSCCSPTIQTPQITASVLKNNGLKTEAPHTMGTGRKVCISGFSAKRWGTHKKKTKQQLSFQDRTKEDLGFGDVHSPSLLFSTSLLTSSFMNSTTVLNLNLSTDSLTGRDPQKDHQRWARLRAALSLHRRKKVEAESPSTYPVRRRNGGKMSLRSQNSSLLLLSPFQSSLCANELTDAEKVFAECQQDGPVPFSDCLTLEQLSRCQKVGEGVYGEVFRTLRAAQHVALKVIPIEGSQKVNGEHQKRFAEILPEIIISKELSLLNGGEENRTGGFIQLHSAHCVRGSYPLELLSAWDTFAEEKGTDNERPDLFEAEQIFMILEFEFGGDDLERMSSKLPSVVASRSILHQVTAALAVAEEELRFEHRDLHWGNLLIEKSSSCTMSMCLRGERLDIPSGGIQVKIIDYTLSRLDKDGLTVFCDLSTDEELFQGKGDLQFDVYRGMRHENKNTWSSYRPHSNVLWLHYLCDKLLTEVKYIKKPTSAPQRRELRRLQDFRKEVKQFGSATEVLKKSRLFK